MVKKLKSVFTLLLIIISTSSSACEENIILEWVKTADAVSDAKKNVTNGEYRFKAMYEYTLMLPGLAETEEYEAKTKDYFVAIEGTSDTPCNIKLVNLAIKYAKNYNLKILNLRKTNIY